MKLYTSPKQLCDPSAKTFVSVPAMLLAAGLTCAMMAQSARAAGFKITNIHFETNASACDMGIQIAFDNEGVTEGAVQDPNGVTVYSLNSAGAMKATGGQTEGFLEGIEPQIKELLSALGCAPSTEEGTSTLAALFAAWPAGSYTFTGRRNGATLQGHDRLTHHIPAGAKVLAPLKGAVLSDAAVLIRWKPVTAPIVHTLGPVNIVGYHVIVYEAGGEVTPQLDVDLPASEASLKVPAQFLKPSTTYQFEVCRPRRAVIRPSRKGFSVPLE